MAANFCHEIILTHVVITSWSQPKLVGASSTLVIITAGLSWYIYISYWYMYLSYIHVLYNYTFCSNCAQCIHWNACLRSKCFNSASNFTLSDLKLDAKKAWECGYCYIKWHGILYTALYYVYSNTSALYYVYSNTSALYNPLTLIMYCMSFTTDT